MTDSLRDAPDTGPGHKKGAPPVEQRGAESLRQKQTSRKDQKSDVKNKNNLRRDPRKGQNGPPTSEQRAALLSAALDYAQAGIPVFPCFFKPSPDDPTVGKKPAHIKEWHVNATTDLEQIREWWKKWPDALIGMPTGAASNIDVIDIDRKKGADGCATVPPWEKLSGCIVKTPTGGYHLHFLHDKTLGLKNWAGQTVVVGQKIQTPGIDTRTTGGYVILPPSYFPDGRAYAWHKGSPESWDLLRSADLADIFREPLAQVAAKASKKRRKRQPDPEYDGRADARAWLDAACERVRTAEPGTSDTTFNNELYVAGAFIREGLLERSVVEEKMFEAARHRIKDEPDKVLLEKLGRVVDDGADKAKLPRKKGPGKRRKHDDDDDSFELKIINGASVKPTLLRWLWKGRIPRGTLTLLVGLPELGKSHVFIDVVARITTGRSMPMDDRAPNPPRRAGIFCTEDRDDTTLVPRLMAVGANLAMVDFIKCLESDDGKQRGFDLTKDIDMLAEYLSRTPDVDLVVFDPITEYLGSRVDDKSNANIRAALGPLMRLLAERDVAAIGVSHLPKAKSGSVQTAALLGSVGFSAAARSSLLVTEEVEDVEDEDGRRRREPTGRRLLCVNKANLAAPEDRQTLAFEIETKTLPLDELPHELSTSAIRWDGAVEITAREIWQDGEGGAPKTKKVDAAMEFIRRAMLDPSSTNGQKVYRDRLATEIVEEAELAGISRATLGRAKRDLDIQSKPKEQRGPHWWLAPASWARAGDELLF